MTGNLIVKDSCLKCSNLWKTVEFGRCNCDGEYSKGLSDAEISWRKRHGRLSEIQKPYSLLDVETPLENVMSAMQKLADESAKLQSLTSGIRETVQKQRTKSKIRNTKVKIEYTISGIEKSKADTERFRNAILKKSENTIILGCIDGSIKSGEIQGWIEKKLRGN
jgi:hypothetical protein